MKSVVLIPYCPFPANDGAKVEMLKYVKVLRDQGECTVVSASRKPVGTPWSAEAKAQLKEMGVELILREEQCSYWNPLQGLGMAFAAVFQGLRLKKAFGHSNPYHRYAFPKKWWAELTRGKDLALIHYSYWAGLPCHCPKVMALLDLYSNFMWEGTGKETRELAGCDLNVVISVPELEQLQERGIDQVFWSPPYVERQSYPPSEGVMLLGSGNSFNVEGLRWLESAGEALCDQKISVYGGLSSKVKSPHLIQKGRYEQQEQPYQENGIVLLLTVQGMGVQIKNH